MLSLMRLHSHISILFISDEDVHTMGFGNVEVEVLGLFIVERCVGCCPEF